MIETEIQVLFRRRPAGREETDAAVVGGRLGAR